MLDDGFNTADTGLNGPLSNLGGADSRGVDAGAGAVAGDGGQGGASGASGSTEDGPTPDAGEPGAELDATTPDLCANGRIDPGEQGVDCGGVCRACNCVWTPFGAPEKITGLGLGATASQWGPALASDGATLILSNAVSGGDEDLYIATRSDRGSLFSAATALTGLNTTADEGTPFISFDGLHLYFYSARSGGVGSRDLYVATRTHLLDTFGNPALLAGVNSAASDHLPWVSPDALTIYFSSARAGGAGGYDLWTATREASDGTFGDLKRLTELASANSDEGASLMADELTIFFASDRASGAGKLDVWMSTRTTKADSFDAPVNVAAVNSDADDMNVAVSADGRELFFSSDRGTDTTPPHVLWRSIRSCE